MPISNGAEVERLAREALSRELAARIARDLLDRARNRSRRSGAELAVDVQRVEALGGAQPVQCQAAARLLAEDGPPDRTALLVLASRLDPLGLDVALAHLAQLERAGRGRDAGRQADRLLDALG
jgi:hypothetical protein